ncbi:hypothetical protein HYPBUDRAFT_152781 [Hyphopichia burtonii NRRL Y-1933]|uniref:RAVE subunit 2/Rogdi n=1 Tax=Hyphopichia burtonii NRRL Y-1933 TaxID=984485 RepID=A0A1E4RLM9_9ASCO|nr:hypothetical protein HYPBUDRAFT_152781 [Hyphopichia burtonii NRRL Y-1933]ODV68167.1 hypothetical protein HYPBUDRAFT_152781 [Hyphopichia burtonii NRRL Y-1933]
MQEVEKYVREIQQETSNDELHWLILSIISPEFPQIIEALEICSNLLLYNTPQHPDAAKHIERGPSIKLPVSSTKLEALKGIIVRDGAYVTQLTVLLKERHFNRVLHRLNLSKPILLSQIITAKRSIDNAIDIINTSKTILGVQHEEHENLHVSLIEQFNQLLIEIQTAKNSLQLPTNPSLVFPVNVTPADAFDPELTPDIAIDLYISQAEVCIDLKNLHRVQDKPWCEIDANSGKSYVDKIRDEMKLPTTTAHSSISTSSNSTPVPSQPLNIADIQHRLHQLSSSSSAPNDLAHPQPQTPSNLFNNMLNHLLIRPKFDPVDYITKCITYNDLVVMINKKIEVSSPDPVLVSAFTKLDSIEYLISNFLENIHKIMDASST